jgi:predicted pyridoxine 5'-phosphate oxidase superfamily flavin-nucleotide-binding protein
MVQGFMDIALTPSVRAVQEAMGSERLWAGLHGRHSDQFGNVEAAFIAERDSFYLASVSETGWPYVQHRGGPPGFVAMLDERTLAFADYRGNRQYISTGNISAEPRVCLFMMDYARRARLKIYAGAEILALDTDHELSGRFTASPYRARLERIFRLTLEGFDWNCPQHINPRYSGAQVAEAVAPLHERIAALEAENAELRAQAGLTPRAGSD